MGGCQRASSGAQWGRCQPERTSLRAAGTRGCRDSGSRGNVPVRTQWQEPRNFLLKATSIGARRGPGLWIPSRSLSEPDPCAAALPYRTGAAHATATGSDCQWYDASPSHGRCHPCACLVQPCSTKAAVASIANNTPAWMVPSISYWYSTTRIRRNLPISPEVSGYSRTRVRGCPVLC